MMTPERKEEIISTLFGWLIDEVLLRDDVSWGGKAFLGHQSEMRLYDEICKNDLDDRQHPEFDNIWNEALRRYDEIPLIKALK